MKIDRLIGILSILQKGGRVTAPWLAERFEVSRRTISRDIEDICRAGIPVVTTQGAGGGIALMDGYRVDTTLFTESELRTLFAGIRSLDSVSAVPQAKILAGKFSQTGTGSALADDIVIDLASFYRNSLTEKIALLQQAIRERHVVCFRYYYRKGEADVQAEPYALRFQWSDWYLYAYTPKRRGFRLYKLLRLWELRTADGTFCPRALPDDAEELSDVITDGYRVTGLFAPEVKYRLVEEYGPDSFSEQPDGRLLFTRGFMYQEDAAEWFLSFGDRAEALSPPELRDELRRLAGNIFSQYS